VKVNFTFNCSNLVSSDFYNELLILEQAVENLAVAAPDFCQTFTLCHFNITMDAGNNLQYARSMGDASDTIESFIILFEPLQRLNYTYEFQRTSTISVQAQNSLSDETATDTLEIQHTVEGNLEFEFQDGGYVNRADGVLQIKVWVLDTESGQPSGVRIRVYMDDESPDSSSPEDVVYVNGEFYYDFPLSEVGAHVMHVEIYNDVSSIVSTQYAYVQEPIPCDDIGAPIVKRTTENGNAVTAPTNDDGWPRFLFGVHGIEITATDTPGTNVTYEFSSSFGLENNENGIYEVMPSSTGYPVIITVTASNEVSSCPQDVSCIVYSDVPVGYFYNITTTYINKTETLVAPVTLTETVAGGIQYPDLCFRIKYETEGGDPYLFFFGISRITCLVIHDRSDVDDNFNQLEYVNGNELHMSLTFREIANFTVDVQVMTSDGEEITMEFITTVLDIPCSAPVITPRDDVNGLDPSSPYEMRRSDSKLFQSDDFFGVELACERTSTVNYRWELYEMFLGNMVLREGSCPVGLLGMNCPTHTLNYSTYIITYTVMMGNYEEFQSSHNITFSVSRTPFTCDINNLPTVQIGTGHEVYLQVNCVDPDGLYRSDLPSLQRYRWYCRNESEAEATLEMINETSSEITLPETAPDITSAGCYGSGPGVISNFDGDMVTIDTLLMASPTDDVQLLKYYFTVLISIPVAHARDRLTLAAVELQITIGEPVQLALATCEVNCDNKINPQAEYRRTFSCLNCDNSSPSRAEYIWTLSIRDTEAPVSIDSFETTDASAGTSTLSLPPNAVLSSGESVLSEGVWYKLEVVGTMTGMVAGRAELEFFVNRSPYNGECSIHPRAGTALVDEFQVSCENWADDLYSTEETVDNIPAAGSNINDLTFSYAYKVGDNAESTYPSGRGMLPAGPGSAGEVKILVYIQDVTHSSTVYEFSVYVTQAQGEEAQAVLDDTLSDITSMDPTEIGSNFAATINTMSALTQMLTPTTSTADTEDATPEETGVEINGAYYFVPAGSSVLQNGELDFILDCRGGPIILEDGGYVLMATGTEDIVCYANNTAVIINPGSIVVNTTSDGTQPYRDSMGNPVVIPEASNVLRLDNGSLYIDPSQNIVIVPEGHYPVEDASGEIVIYENEVFTAEIGQTLVYNPINIMEYIPISNTNSRPLLAEIGSTAAVDENNDLVENSAGYYVVAGPGMKVLTFTDGRILREDGGDGSVVIAQEGTEFLLQTDDLGNPVLDAAVINAQGKILLIEPGEEILRDPDTGEPIIVGDDGYFVIVEAGSEPVIVNGAPLYNDQGEPYVLPAGGDITLQFDDDGSLVTDSAGNPVLLDTDENVVLTDIYGSMISNPDGEPIILMNNLSPMYERDDDDRIVAIEYDGSGAPIIVDEFHQRIFTNPQTLQVVLNGEDEPLIYVTNTILATGDDGSILINEETGDPTILHCLVIDADTACVPGEEVFFDDRGQIVTDGQGGASMGTTEAPPTTPPLSEEEIAAQEDVGAAFVAMSSMVALVASDAASGGVTNEIADQMVTVMTGFVEAMPVNAKEEDKLAMLGNMESACDFLAASESPDDFTDMASGLLNNINSLTVSLATSLDSSASTASATDEDNPDFTPDDTPEAQATAEASEAQRQEAEAIQRTTSEVVNGSAIKILNAVNSQDSLTSLHIGEHELSMSVEPMGEAGADISSGDTEVVMPPTVNDGATEGQSMLAQVVNNEVNAYSWDPSASDVSGAVTMNFYGSGGSVVTPDFGASDLEIAMASTVLPTLIDFTNKTFNNVTGMLYASMFIDQADNALIIKINRPVSDVPLVNYTVAMFFNATNTTDPDIGRPNLTSYDYIIDFPIEERDSLSLSWTYVIPQEEIIPGLFIMGVYIYDGTDDVDLENGTWTHTNRTVPYFSFYVMFTRCRTFNGEKWISSYCTVMLKSDMSRTVCKCPLVGNPDEPSTAFSSGSSSPLVNTIDFDYLWDNFAELLLDSWPVWTTELVIFGLYILLGVYVRRKDKADVLKWTILPLADNQPIDAYYYKMSVYTGLRNSAGTKSTICFILSGEFADTGLRILSDGKKNRQVRGSVRHYVMSTKTHMGHMAFLRIWHDNSGKGENASWFLDKVEVEDLQTSYRYYFLNNRWLAVDEEDGLVQRMLPVANEDEVTSFNHLFNTTARSKISDEHLWVSVMTRPTRSNFTRLQRLTCCLLILFSTMIANCMFFKDGDDASASPILFQIGSAITVSEETLLVSIIGTAVVVPINMIVVLIFRKSKPKYAWSLPQDIAREQATKKCKAPDEKDVRGILFPTDKSQMMKGKGGATYDPDEEDLFKKKKPGLSDELEKSESPVPKPAKKKKWWKQKYPLPYWCQYIAWFLALGTSIICAAFVTMYGMQWGFDKSCRWMSALMLSFVQSVVIIQPIKVVIIAMIVSCIFKKLDHDDDDLDEEERRNNVEASSDEVLLEPKDGSKTFFIPEPPDPEVLRTARQKREYDKMMWDILKEIFFYIFFLCLICFIAWGGKDDRIYTTCNDIHNQFNPLPENDSATYVSDGTKFWAWASQTMVEALYNKQDYAGNYNSERDRQFLSDAVNYKVGVPRLRQVRMGRGTCDILNNFRGIVNSCIDGYSESEEEARNFVTGWSGVLPDNYTERNIDAFDEVQKAFIFQSAWDLKGLPYWGKHGMYNGGGYVAQLSNSPVTAKSVIEQLQDSMWVDRYTRAVFLEVTVYNANTNLFAFIEYLFEFPSMGSVMPFLRVYGFVVYANHGPSGSMVLAAQVLYLFILIYFIYHEIKTIREQGFKDYIREPWNLYEVILIVTSVIGIAMYALKILFGKLLTSDLAEDIEAYTNYMAFAAWDESLTYVIGTIIFLANLKFLRLLRFNRHIQFLSATIRKAGVELICFSITFFVFFLAYGLMGTVIFGQHLSGFRTFLHTLTSLYSMLLGKFDFMGIRAAQSILGPVFFVTFVMAVYFVLVNMFLGILGIAFYEVRMDTAPTECDKVQFMSFANEQAGYFQESLSESLKNMVTKEKDSDDEDDDDEDTKGDEKKLVYGDSIELNETPEPEPSRPDSAQSLPFGARPYLD